MLGPSPSEARCFIQLKAVAKFDKEVGRYVAGSPELNVWSSGEDPKEALDRAQEAILLFLDETTELGTVWRILDEAGIKLQATLPGPDTFFDRLKYITKGDFFPLTFSVQPPSANATC